MIPGSLTPDEQAIWNRGRLFDELKQNAAFCELMQAIRSYVAQGQMRALSCESNDPNLVMSLVKRAGEREQMLRFIEEEVSAAIEAGKMMEGEEQHVR